MIIDFDVGYKLTPKGRHTLLNLCHPFGISVFRALFL